MGLDEVVGNGRQTAVVGEDRAEERAAAPEHIALRMRFLLPDRLDEADRLGGLGVELGLDVDSGFLLELIDQVLGDFAVGGAVEDDRRSADATMTPVGLRCWRGPFSAPR